MERYFREPINGITHLLGAILGLLGLIWLVVITYPDIDRVIISLVYGVSVILTFTASFVMHSYKGSNEMIERLVRLDHAAIYLMIAGSYTAISYAYLTPFWFTWMMIAIWGMALGGVIWKIFFFRDNSVISLLYYLAMGWFSLALIPQVMSIIDPIAFTLIVSGGICYTVGAVIFGLKRPNFSDLWGHHEIWHLFVLGGFACHFFAVVHHMVIY
ncbi:MAG: hemolysin III family protein [Chloroflexota bacterium]